MYKLNLRLLRRFIVLARPYWTSEQKKKAWGFVALLAGLLVAETWFNVFFNEQSGEFTSALAAGDSPRFWLSIQKYLGLLMIAVPIYSFYYYVRDKLSIHWRRWMTHQLLGRYFEHHAFYRLLQNPEIDNPDQRISQDVASFTQESLNFLLLFSSSALQLLAFSGVLWAISHSLVTFLVLYSAIGTFVTIRVFGEKMVSLHFTQLKREADFRFGLVRVRENAESIALYQGEGQEHAQVKNRFSELYENFNKLIDWTLRLNLFQYTYSLFTMVVPSIILAPRVLSGEMEVGRVIQAAGAFSSILSALTILIENMDNLSGFAAGVGRLDAFGRCLTRKENQAAAGRGRIAMREGDKLSFDDVTLQTPNYERTLVTGLSFAVAPGQSLMIVGPSGCGKSSLLRAMAGLWDAGSGTIERPKPEAMLFVPQHAYMILGNLRGQLCYPNLDRAVSDDELREVLERVNLKGLPERCGGFEVDLDFEKVLSVGERQRLAMARVLLEAPSYVLLDEATSALDPQNETAMFRQLAKTTTTIVSVSHHPGLVKYHSQVLELTVDGGWKLHEAAGFRFTEDLK